MLQSFQLVNCRKYGVDPSRNIPTFVVCLVGWLLVCFRTTLEFCTHMDTSPLPVKGCIF